MERLTFEGNFCDIAQCRELPCKHGGNCSQKQVWERLRAYEDAGLTPERCAEFARADAEGRYIVMRDAEQDGVDRLRELAGADREGRVIVLPCRVGDMVYRTWSAPGHTPFVEEVRMSSVAAIISLLRKFGTTVFLSREEAEKALQEMEGNKKDG